MNNLPPIPVLQPLDVEVRMPNPDLYRDEPVTCEVTRRGIACCGDTYSDDGWRLHWYWAHVVQDWSADEYRTDLES